MTVGSGFGEAAEMANEERAMAASGGDTQDAEETSVAQPEKEDPRLEAARKYVSDWRAAKSQEERDELIQKVLADSQMQTLFDENSELINELGMGDLLSGSKPEGAAVAEAEAKTTELDPALKQAASETLEHLQALLRTSNTVATGGDNEIAALIKAREGADDELGPFTQRMTALQQAIEANDMDVIRQTYDWLKDKNIPFLQARSRATVNYLGGAPEGLVSQINIVKQLEQDVQNLEHYLPRNPETPKAS